MNSYAPLASPEVVAGGDFDERFGLSDLISFLSRRWRIIVAGLLTTLLATALVTFQITPLYSAISSLAVQTQRTQVVDIQDVVSDLAPDNATMETQVSIIRSRNLVGKLVDRLRLERDPEFNARLNRQNFSLLNPATWSGAADLQKSSDLDDEARGLERARIIDAVTAALDVRMAPGSYVITIDATSKDPAKAAALANSLAELYIDDQIEAKYEATKRASSWLEQRVNELRQQVLASDRAVELYRAQNRLVGADGGGVETQQLSEINSQLILARSERAAKGAQLAQVRQLIAAGASDIETSSAIIDSALIQGLRQQESEVLRKMAELQATYGERHPRIINATAELKDLRAKISDEVRKIAASTANEFAVAQARERALADSLRGLESRVGQGGQAEVRLRELQREADASKALYETFLNRYKETREKVDVQTADARIVSLADRPAAPSYPQKPLVFAIALVLGLAVGAGLAVAVELLDNTVRSAQQIERISGRSVLSFVPIVEGKFEAPEDVVIQRPGSMVAEALRTLHNALALVDVDKAAKVLMLTSSVPGEGKTFISAGLARVASQSGRRVILIDADMRHPRLHKAIGVNNDRGLVQAIGAGGDPSCFMQKDPQSDVMILTAGQGAPSPADLLRSQKFKDLIARLRQAYDLVIIDTPPFVPITDGQIVAQLVDQMILVARWGDTPIAVLKNTFQQAFRIGAPLIGSVLSQVDVRQHAKYGYGDYGYQYSKYGAYYGAQA